MTFVARSSLACRRMAPYNLHTSPFLELSSPFTAYEAIKLLLLLPLLPLRLIVGCAVICIINSLAAWGVEEGEPLSAWRRRLVLASKELLPAVFLMMGFHVRVQGRENIARAQQLGAVGLFNHVAW